MGLHLVNGPKIQKSLKSSSVSSKSFVAKIQLYLNLFGHKPALKWFEGTYSFYVIYMVKHFPAIICQKLFPMLEAHAYQIT